MSLDLSPKSGVTTAGTFASGITGFPVDGDLADGNLEGAGFVRAYVDTSGGDVTLTPGPLTGLEQGDTIMFIKTTTGAGRIIFTDPDGVTYSFVNRQSEFIKLRYSGTGWYVV